MSIYNIIQSIISTIAVVLAVLSFLYNRKSYMERIQNEAPEMCVYHFKDHNVVDIFKNEFKEYPYIYIMHMNKKGMYKDEDHSLNHAPEYTVSFESVDWQTCFHYLKSNICFGISFSNLSFSTLCISMMKDQQGYLYDIQNMCVLNALSRNMKVLVVGIYSEHPLTLQATFRDKRGYYNFPTEGSTQATRIKWE